MAKGTPKQPKKAKAKKGEATRTEDPPQQSSNGAADIATLEAVHARTPAGSNPVTPPFMISQPEHDSCYHGDADRPMVRMSTGNFKTLRQLSYAGSQGSTYGANSSNVEYVDLNGKQLDEGYLRCHNMLPGQGGIRIFLEDYDPNTVVQQPSFNYNDSFAGSGSRNFCTHPHELRYSDSISPRVQERYAALRSEPMQVRSSFLLVTNSPQRPANTGSTLGRPGEYQDLEREHQAINPVHGYLCNSGGIPVDTPSIYRVVESKGRRVVSDLYLHPITGHIVNITGT